MTIRIDNSMLGDVLSCSTRGWVKYVQHKQMRQMTGPSERMGVGRLFHGLFEKCLQGEALDPMLYAFECAWYATFPHGVQEEKYQLANLLIIAETWLRHNSTYFRDYTPVAIEQYLEMPLGDNVTFFGTLDALVENTRGELWIVESKTTGWLTEIKKQYWMRGSQGMGYWELVKYHYGREPKGVLWNVVEITKIPPYDGNLMKKCSKHGVKYQECQFTHVKHEMVGPVVYQVHQLDAWCRQLLEGAGKLDTLQYVTPEMIDQMHFNQPLLPTEGRFTYPGCSQCDLTDWCWAGRPVHMMQGMMEEY